MYRAETVDVKEPHLAAGLRVASVRDERLGGGAGTEREVPALDGDELDRGAHAVDDGIDHRLEADRRHGDHDRHRDGTDDQQVLEGVLGLVAADEVTDTGQHEREHLNPLTRTVVGFDERSRHRSTGTEHRAGATPPFKTCPALGLEGDRHGISNLQPSTPFGCYGPKRRAYEHLRIGTVA